MIFPLFWVFWLAACVILWLGAARDLWTAVLCAALTVPQTILLWRRSRNAAERLPFRNFGPARGPGQAAKYPEPTTSEQARNS